MKTTQTVRNVVLFRDPIYLEIDAERDRQDAKFGYIGSDGTILPGDDEWAKSAVLGEEFGEVCHAILEGDWDNLEDELVQVAAVAVAWLEARREKAAQA